MAGAPAGTKKGFSSAHFLPSPQIYLPREAQPTVGSISNQEPITDQADQGNASSELPSSQATLVYGKLSSVK